MQCQHVANCESTPGRKACAAQTTITFDDNYSCETRPADCGESGAHVA